MTADSLASRLAAHGLDETEGARKRLLCQLVLDRFTHSVGGVPDEALWVPGRIEVFGKHTDYAGGHSLVAPVPRGFVFAARPRSDRTVAIADAARGEQFSIDFDAGNVGPMCSDAGHPPGSQDPGATKTGVGPGSSDPGQLTGWRRYAATTVQRLTRNFPAATLAADIVFASDLPPSSGMSSSSALVVGVAAVLVRLAGIEARPEWQSAIGSAADSAGYYACIENGLAFASLAGDAGVGTHGGSEDHVALVCGRAGHVSAWRFVPIQHVADVAVPADWQFVIASSGVAAKKTGGARDAYNRLSLLARSLLELWNGSDQAASSLRAALSSDPTALETLRALIRERAQNPAELEHRLTHFLNEDARTAAAVEAFRESRRDRIGALSGESQSDAERLLQNQVPETTRLAAIARALGAFGASSFGAGFGGSVWALVQKSDAPEFSARWLSEYRSEFPAREAATVFAAPPGPSLTWLD